MEYGLDTRVVSVDGRPIRLFEAGTGPPVVVLHGWGGRIESMTPVLLGLRDRFRVMAIDLPGFGESPAPTVAWGTDEYAELVSHTLDSVGVARAAFVGHSYGAKTSVYLAAARPDMVDRLVLAGSSGLRAAPSASVRAKRTLSKVGRVVGHLGAPGRALRDGLYRRIASEDYRAAGDMRPVLVKVVNEDFSALLPSVRCPVLLIWGSKDDAVPVAHARRMESLIPDAGLVVFEGAGHFAYLEEPDRFVRIVAHFLAPR